METSILPHAKDVAVATLHAALATLAKQIESAKAEHKTSCDVCLANKALCELVKKACDAQGYKTSNIVQQADLHFCFSVSWYERLLELGKPCAPKAAQHLDSKLAITHGTIARDAAQLADLILKCLIEPEITMMHMHVSPVYEADLLEQTKDYLVATRYDSHTQCFKFSRGKMLTDCLAIANKVTEQLTRASEWEEELEPRLQFPLVSRILSLSGIFHVRGRLVDSSLFVLFKKL